jgi:hypothetical protein
METGLLPRLFLSEGLDIGIEQSHHKAQESFQR